MQVGCGPGMPAERTDDLVGRRLALYAYLEPLLSGRRVLEIEARPGRGAVPAGESTQYLRSLRARGVTVDRDATGDHRFAVVVAPEADELPRRPEAFGTIRKLLVEGGRAIIA